MAPIPATIKAAAFAVATICAAGAMGAVTATPAAAGEPAISLHFGVDAKGQPGFGFDVQSGYPTRFPPGHPGNLGQNPGPRFDACLNDRQVVAGLRDNGYRRIDVTYSTRHSAEVEADYGRYHYVLDVDRCTGFVDILDRERIGRGYGFEFSSN